MRQLDLFPDHQNTVVLYFTDFGSCVRLNAYGGGLEIHSFWQTLVAFITAFPVIFEYRGEMTLQHKLTTSLTLSEEDWRYWIDLNNWPNDTCFFWN